MKIFTNIKTGEKANVHLSENGNYLLVRFVNPEHMQYNGWWRYEFPDFFTVSKSNKMTKPWADIPSFETVYWPEHSDLPYTKQDFIDLIGHGYAEKLFNACTWEAPETVLDQDSHEPILDKEFPTEDEKIQMVSESEVQDAESETIMAWAAEYRKAYYELRPVEFEQKWKEFSGEH